MRALPAVAQGAARFALGRDRGRARAPCEQGRREPYRGAAIPHRPEGCRAPRPSRPKRRDTGSVPAREAR